jgi:hypothetical protein
MKHDIGKDSNIDFLRWLRGRLVNRYKEDPLVVNNLDNIINNKKIVSKTIDVNLVEKICEKFWPGFTPETSEFFGSVDRYGEQEKNEIRHLVTKILGEARRDCS